MITWPRHLTFTWCYYHFQVDKRSLIIFPAVSILFNAGYWVHFVLARAWGRNRKYLDIQKIFDAEKLCEGRCGDVLMCHELTSLERWLLAWDCENSTWEAVTTRRPQTRGLQHNTLPRHHMNTSPVKPFSAVVVTSAVKRSIGSTTAFHNHKEGPY